MIKAEFEALVRRPTGQHSVVSAPSSAPVNGGGVRILVVDDDERNLLAVQTVLEDTAEVVLASSGEEALRHLLKGEFAVILLDVFMPDMDGYECAQLIRSREQTKRIPIVFLSAVNKESEHLMRGYAMGAVDYVFKPVDPVVLRSKVSVFVDLFAMRREIQRKAEHEQRLLDEALAANAEKLRLTQELRQSEQRQAAIIQSLPMLFFIETNPETRLLSFVSGDLPGLTGLSVEMLEGETDPWRSRLHPDDLDRVLAAHADRWRHGKMEIEYRWRCGDGSYRHFLDQSVLLPGADGAPGHYAGSLLDITERKLLETELTHSRKMEAIGKLTGGIAHDFNNLLAAVLGGIGLIERRLPVTEDQRKILTMSRHAAEQGVDLVSRLLAFSRSQALAPTSVDLDKLAISGRGLLSHTLGGLVDLQWVPADNTWSPYADAAQLELALMNLIINARDAMPEGGVVTVTTANRTVGEGHARLRADDYVVIAVRDNGTGIPPELIERVLEPFFTTKPIGKGTGLGLSMVYGFANQSGGTVAIQSAVGEGTVIELWLPRSPAGAVVLDSTKPGGSALPAGTLGALQILLVDDHLAVRATTAALLADLGHYVIDVGDTSSALEALRETRFDLLITDYAMPNLSGAELIRRARDLVPNLPSLIITGYAEGAAVSSRPSNVEVVLKPFEPHNLVFAIENQIALSRRASVA
jgi:PAS domain S-box-containing protein